MVYKGIIPKTFSETHTKINVNKYVIYFYLGLSSIAIIFLGISLYIARDNGKLDYEKAQLEKERAAFLEERKTLQGNINRLQKENRGLKNKYLEAIKEYENTEKHDNFDSAINDFFK